MGDRGRERIESNREKRAKTDRKKEREKESKYVRYGEGETRQRNKQTKKVKLYELPLERSTIQHNANITQCSVSPEGEGNDVALMREGRADVWLEVDTDVVVEDVVIIDSLEFLFIIPGTR